MREFNQPHHGQARARRSRGPEPTRPYAGGFETVVGGSVVGDQDLKLSRIVGERALEAFQEFAQEITGPVARTGATVVVVRDDDGRARHHSEIGNFARRTAEGASRRLPSPPMSADFPPVEAPRLALRVLMMPRDTNHQGTIFGGIILAHIDQAGYIEARRHGLHRWVTACIDRVDFKASVHTGEVIELKTRTIRLGRTSVAIQVLVDAERLDGSWARVTEAQMTMVAVDDTGKAMPFRDSPTPEAH